MNTPLFQELDPFVMDGINLLPSILNKVMPTNANHKRDLKYACRDLSRELTIDRDALSRPYWSSPRFMSAYAHYFLPWNLVRLSKLFPALEFGEIPENPLIVDLGSGPLTLPIALWLSRKDLRKIPLTFLCMDSASQPLELGKNIFHALRERMDPSSPWIIYTKRNPLHQSLQSVKGNPWLITLGNVLNESEENKYHPLQKQIIQLVTEANNILLPDGKIFAVEPGTRQGARVLSVLRQVATQSFQDEEECDDYDSDDDYYGDTDNDQNYDSNYDDAHDDDHDDNGRHADEHSPFYDDMDSQDNNTAPFFALSPCPHQEECPLTKMGKKHLSAWCHFNVSTQQVPNFLRKLSQDAGMDKESVSLSFLFLARRNDENAMKQHQENMARIISEAFFIPDLDNRVRYACHKKGLLLVTDSARLAPATLCEVQIESPARYDQKSGAIMAHPKDFNTTQSNLSPQRNTKNRHDTKSPEEHSFNKKTPQTNQKQDKNPRGSKNYSHPK